MDANAFDLTPEQKDLLIALAAETGKPVAALLAEALAGLQDQVPACVFHGFLPLSPREACHPIHGKVATQST